MQGASGCCYSGPGGGNGPHARMGADPPITRARLRRTDSQVPFIGQTGRQESPHRLLSLPPTLPPSRHVPLSLSHTHPSSLAHLPPHVIRCKRESYARPRDVLCPVVSSPPERLLYLERRIFECALSPVLCRIHHHLQVMVTKTVRLLHPLPPLQPRSQLVDSDYVRA